MPMTAHLFTRRALLGGLVFAAYGLWQAAVRLPAGLGIGTYTVSSFWAVALFAAAGLLLSLALAGLALAATRPIPLTWRASVSALIEAVCWLPIILWLVLNEVVYSTTAEVLGYDAILLTWHNTAATFQNAWQMGGPYLIGVLVATTGIAALLWWLSRRSFRSLWPIRSAGPPLPTCDGLGGRPNPLRVAASLTGGLVLLATLLTWQVSTGPGTALAAVLRSSPPLKALNLPRTLLGDELRLAGAAATGPPIISDQAYAASMGPLPDSAPNVVLIVLESVSARSLHCYGYPREDVSPHMDALAAGGVLFEHCWSTASFSSYGLVSVMTSLHLLRDEVNDHFTDRSFPHMSIPRAFKLAGYETAMFSSGNESFDHINEFCRPADFDRYYTHDTSGIQHPDCMRMDDKYAFGEFEKWMHARTARGGPPQLNARNSELRTQNPEPRPFYASFYLQATHFDYAVPEPWASHYQPTPPLLGNGNGIIRIPPDVLPLLRNQYDNAMRYSDYWVGRIVESLKAAGAFDNSVIAIIGDHGEAFMEHGLARHGVHLWEEMIHVPLIVHVGPKLRERLGRRLPSRVPDTVSGLDLAPTLAALAELAPHPSWQGLDVLAPGYTSEHRPVYSVLQLTRWQEAVTVDQLKYIYDLSDVERYLFDLADDPGEKRNLAAERPEQAAAMHHLLRLWHTHQLSYYSRSRRPFTHYIGIPDIPETALEAVRRSGTSEPAHVAGLE